MEDQTTGWLSETEAALIVAISAIANVLISKGAATGEEIDAALFSYRDRYAARDMPKSAALLALVAMQRLQGDPSQSKLSELHREMPQGRA